jgi:phosphoglycolate phosphatase
MKHRVLITDLDNTLYDWVTFFSTAFNAMVAELARILDTDRPSLLSQFKEIHERYGSTETPWAALELPAAKLKFPGFSATALAGQLLPAFDVFSAERQKHLNLYAGVADTLQQLSASGVVIIGHTEALAVNAYQRLALLGISRHFTRLYALDGKLIDHPFPNRTRSVPPPRPDLIRTLPASERKPNPAVLLDICGRERVNPIDACYVGDSLIRDVAMAKRADVFAVWARYGTIYDPSLWDLLVAVTHWTPADVEREAQLRHSFKNVQPDSTIDTFDELIKEMAAA